MTKAGLTRTLLFSVAEKKLAQNFLAEKKSGIFFSASKINQYPKNAKQLLLVFFRFANERKISDTYPAKRKKIKISESLTIRGQLAAIKSWRTDRPSAAH